MNYHIKRSYYHEKRVNYHIKRLLLSQKAGVLSQKTGKPLNSGIYTTSTLIITKKEKQAIYRA